MAKKKPTKRRPRRASTFRCSRSHKAITKQDFNQGAVAWEEDHGSFMLTSYSHPLLLHSRCLEELQKEDVIRGLTRRGETFRKFHDDLLTLIMHKQVKLDYDSIRLPSPKAKRKDSASGPYPNGVKGDPSSTI